MKNEKFSSWFEHIHKYLARKGWSWYMFMLSFSLQFFSFTCSCACNEKQILIRNYEGSLIGIICKWIANQTDRIDFLFLVTFCWQCDCYLLQVENCGSGRRLRYNTIQDKSWEMLHSVARSAVCELCRPIGLKYESFPCEKVSTKNRIQWHRNEQILVVSIALDL